MHNCSGDCGKHYVGETQRPKEIRLRERKVVSDKDLLIGPKSVKQPDIRQRKYK
jgi:hypothetical protein